MRLLIVAATSLELGSFRERLSNRQDNKRGFRGEMHGHEVQCLITGIGSVATALQLGRQLSIEKFDVVVNVGIGGAFPEKLMIGDTVLVGSEIFGDLGVEECCGDFLDLFEVGLVDVNEFPYRDGLLLCNFAALTSFQLPVVKGLTVNCVHGSKHSISSVMQKYDVDVESMEGAAVFYTCLEFGVKCLELRSISNIVECRNKENWNIPLAVSNLEISLDSILTKLKSASIAI